MGAGEKKDKAEGELGMGLSLVPGTGLGWRREGGRLRS